MNATTKTAWIVGAALIGLVLAVAAVAQQKNSTARIPDMPVADDMASMMQNSGMAGMMQGMEGMETMMQNMGEMPCHKSPEMAGMMKAHHAQMPEDMQEMHKSMHGE